MKIPRSVKILGDRVTIHQVDAVTMKKCVEGEDGVLGLALLLEDKILLLKSLPPKEKYRVLIHEICHFVLYRTAGNIGLTGELEEVVCQSFSTALAQMGVKLK